MFTLLMSSFSVTETAVRCVPLNFARAPAAGGISSSSWWAVLWFVSDAVRLSCLTKEALLAVARHPMQLVPHPRVSFKLIVHVLPVVPDPIFNQIQSNFDMKLILRCSESCTSSTGGFGRSVREQRQLRWHKECGWHNRGTRRRFRGTSGLSWLLMGSQNCLCHSCRLHSGQVDRHFWWGSAILSHVDGSCLSQFHQPCGYEETLLVSCLSRL